jgi:hypothetical protein
MIPDRVAQCGQLVGGPGSQAQEVASARDVPASQDEDPLDHS